MSPFQSRLYNLKKCCIFYKISQNKRFSAYRIYDSVVSPQSLNGFDFFHQFSKYCSCYNGVLYLQIKYNMQFVMVAILALEIKLTDKHHQTFFRNLGINQQPSRKLSQEHPKL